MSTIWAQANPTGQSGYSTTTENGSYGLFFTVATAGTVEAIWFYSPSGASGLPTSIALYQTTNAEGTTGTQLAQNTSVTWSGAAGSGWVRGAFTTGVAVTSGNTYVGQYYGASFGQAYLYTGSGTFPTCWFPTTSADGNITAVEFCGNSNSDNGLYLNGSNGYPNTQHAGTALNWLLDVEVSFGSGPPEYPTPPRIPHPLWWQLLEVAQTRADWQAQGAASPVATTWRLMDGANGRPGTGSSGTQPPASATANSGNFIPGLSFYVTQGGMWFEGYWWYVAASGGQSTSAQKFALWSDAPAVASGSLVVPGTVVTSGTLSTGWNWVPLAQPVQLSPYGIYVAATTVNSGPFPETSAQFSSGGPYSGGITNGPLSCLSDANGSNAAPAGYVSNGCYATTGSDPSLVMPADDSSSAGDLLWLDVQVTNTAPASYNGSYRLWPNTADADSETDQDSAVNYVVGTEFTLSEPCVINAIWYFASAGQGASGNQWATSADIWRVRDGVRVATQPNPVWIKPFTGGVDGQSNDGRWVYCTLPGTVTLPAGDYKVSVYNGNGSPNGWSAKRLGYWQAYNQAPEGTYQTQPPGAAGITNGPLAAPTTPAASAATDFTTSATEPGQSVFQSGPPNQYPDLYVGQPSNLFQNYWVDVEVTPASTWQPDAPDLPQRAGHPAWNDLLEAIAEKRISGNAAATVNTVVPGAAAGLTLAAPAGSVTASSSAAGQPAALSLAAPAGSIEADSSVTGTAAALALAAPAGTAGASEGATGTPAALALAAPAGSVTVSSSVTGTPAPLALGAPAGAVVAGTVVAGATAALTLAAPAGTLAISPSVTGAAAALALAAPAGTVSAGATITGQAAALALAAPPGTAGVNTTTVAGQPAALTLAAPPGSVAAFGAGGLDPDLLGGAISSTSTYGGTITSSNAYAGSIG